MCEPPSAGPRAGRRSYTYTSPPTCTPPPAWRTCPRLEKGEDFPPGALLLVACSHVVCPATLTCATRQSSHARQTVAATRGCPIVVRVAPNESSHEMPRAPPSRARASVLAPRLPRASSPPAPRIVKASRKTKLDAAKERTSRVIGVMNVPSNLKQKDSLHRVLQRTPLPRMSN